MPMPIVGDNRGVFCEQYTSRPLKFDIDRPCNVALFDENGSVITLFGVYPKNYSLTYLVDGHSNIDIEPFRELFQTQLARKNYNNEDISLIIKSLSHEFTGKE